MGKKAEQREIEFARPRNQASKVQECRHRTNSKMWFRGAWLGCMCSMLPQCVFQEHVVSQLMGAELGSDRPSSISGAAMSAAHNWFIFLLPIYHLVASNHVHVGSQIAERISNISNPREAPKE